MNEKDLAELLKRCRTTAGLTQLELANKLHIDRTYISKIENGESVPNINVARDWGVVTGCSDLVSTYISGKESWKEIMGYKMAIRAVKNGLDMLEVSV